MLESETIDSRESTYKDALDGGAIFGVQHVPGPLRIRHSLLMLSLKAKNKPAGSVYLFKWGIEVL